MVAAMKGSAEAKDMAMEAAARLALEMWPVRARGCGRVDEGD